MTKMPAAAPIPETFDYVVVGPVSGWRLDHGGAREVGQMGNTSGVLQLPEAVRLPELVERLALDLADPLPRHAVHLADLHYMRKLATEYPDSAFVQQAAAQIPWGHLMVLLDKVEPGDRAWYAAQARANGWSRAVLAFQISTEAHTRLGAAPTNFSAALPGPESDLAREMVKDPYIPPTEG